MLGSSGLSHHTGFWAVPDQPCHGHVAHGRLHEPPFPFGPALLGPLEIQAASG